MSVTVIPAYRVIRKFIRDVEGLPWDAMLDALESNVRIYVQHLLSGTQASFAELDRRTALTQLGDPDPHVLAHALETIESGDAKAIVEEVIQKCVQALP